MAPLLGPSFYSSVGYSYLLYRAAVVQNSQQAYLSPLQLTFTNSERGKLDKNQSKLFKIHPHGKVTNLNIWQEIQN